MTTEPDFIARMDVSVYDTIPSQTSRADRRAMLGVHAAYQRHLGRFAYLEIGSHLGGSLQPYVLNPNCTRIYSIDARPESTPDDRIQGGSSDYPGNSTARMLSLLSALSEDCHDKITTFDSDASQIDPGAISEPPAIAFIDGEHTDRAVRSDFGFCNRVLAPGGAIVFHDYRILRTAIDQVSAAVAGQGGVAFRIEGDVFGIFTDRQIVQNDPYLSARLARHERMRPYYPLEWGWWRVRDVLMLPKRIIAREWDTLR